MTTKYTIEIPKDYALKSALLKHLKKDPRGNVEYIFDEKLEVLSPKCVQSYTPPDLTWTEIRSDKQTPAMFGASPSPVNESIARFLESLE